MLHKIGIEAEAFNCLSQMVQNSTFDPEAIKSLREVVKSAREAKKILIADSLFDLCVSTEGYLEDEIVLGHLKHVELPFETLWIESKIPQEVRNIEAFKEVERFGALICKNENGSFTVNAFPLTYPDEETAMGFKQLRGGVALPRNGGGKSLLLETSNICLTLDPEVGINFDEDKIFHSMTMTQKKWNDYADAGVSGIDKQDPTVLIDLEFFIASYVARILMVMDAVCMPREGLKKDDEDSQEIRKDKSRRAVGRPSRFSLRPVLMDATRLNAFAQAKTAKEASVLLGWTLVKRSKEIVSKYGKRYRRKKHDRRIKADQDRRNEVRIAFASHPDATLTPDTPATLIWPGAASAPFVA